MMLQDRTSGEVEWKVSNQPVPYGIAVEWMDTRIAQIKSGTAPEVVWLLEHPPMYTAGTSSNVKDLIDPDRFPVFKTQRGGQYTYHGPGQRIIYVMLDVAKRGHDVRKFIKDLENWIIDTLAEFNLAGEVRKGRVGVWIQRPDLPFSSQGTVVEQKIAAIGIRLRKWVSYHGISINLNPNLNHFSGIIPCGIDGFGITSFADLGRQTTFKDLDLALRKTFNQTF